MTREKDKVFRTNRDTRCLSVLLNRDWVAGLARVFADRTMPMAG